MDSRQRAELFLAINLKMDEIQEIVKNHDATEDFLASYCFGLSTDTPLTQHFTNKISYEFFAGFNAENTEEIDAMFDAMERIYEESEETHGPSNKINYWINLN